jgi:hypothetical protein
MTKAGPKKAAPQKTKVRHWAEWLRIVFIAICFIAIIVTALRNESRTSELGARVTKVESPCLKSSEEPTLKNKRLCRESFEKAIGTITHPEACAVERKAGTLKALRELGRQLQINFKEPCKGARLAQERRRGSERAATKATASVPPSGGDASTPSTVHSIPAPGNGGATDHPSKPNAPSVPHQSHGGESTEKQRGSGGREPGEEPGVPPPAPTSSSSPEQSSSPTTERETVVEEPQAEVPQPVREGVGQVLGGVGAVVEETGGTVNQAVEGVAGTTCSLAKVLCHE